MKRYWLSLSICLASFAMMGALTACGGGPKDPTSPDAELEPGDDDAFGDDFQDGGLEGGSDGVEDQPELEPEPEFP